MSCYQVKVIDKTECIGNSLSKINGNFEGLQGSSETPGTVCGNDALITDLRLDIANLNSDVISLSSQIIPGLAKAWVKFDGTRDSTNIKPIPNTNTDRFIYSQYNISSVYRKTIGDYRITFESSFATSNYVLVGTSSQIIGSTGQFTWLQPYTYRTTYVDVRVMGNTALTVNDPDHCSIVIF